MPSYRDPFTGRFTTLKKRQRKLAQLEKKYAGLSVDNPKVAAALERQGFVALVIKRNKRRRRRDGAAQMQREAETLLALAQGEMPKPHETTQASHQGVVYRVETWRFEGYDAGEVETQRLIAKVRDTTEEADTRVWIEIQAGEVDTGDGENTLTLEFTTASDALTRLANWKNRPSAGKILSAAKKGETIWYIVHVAHTLRPQAPKKRRKKRRKNVVANRRLKKPAKGRGPGKSKRKGRGASASRAGPGRSKPIAAHGDARRAGKKHPSQKRPPRPGKKAARRGRGRFE